MPVAESVSKAPFLPQTLQDWAQVVSAVGTALAVIVALYIAFRGERTRLRIYLGRHVNLVLGVGPQITTYGLQVTIVNIGTLPATITGAHITIKGGSPPVRSGIGLAKFDSAKNAANLPTELSHGQQWSSVILIDMGQQPWSRIACFLQFCTLRAQISTSTGRRYRLRLQFSTALRLWRDLKAPSAEIIG